ncbi:hypothetical protein J3R30DRAFT_3488654 [Lentinula aciculospora]|uniref:Uncharacterized protein n=1 Tax=Lentinula aciculospora TaxID=153920 RepID=A0A9W9AAV7_9AGAR|nr:hypothetical protein J3R30DRAFT_3488654 [Lentinula aciculospora]
MLKRQRAPSPPPSSSSNAPLISDFTPVEKARDIKRRRVQPPVLDGQKRGWATSQDILYETFDDVEDDGEEDIVDDDEPYLTLGASHSSDLNSPYKSANGFLHELHTLHRHRLSLSHNSLSQLSSSNYPADESSSNQPHAYNQHLFPPGKGLPPLITPTHVPSQQRSYELSPSTSNIGKQHETNSIKGHYEENNKLLGSVVLSRRQQLELSLCTLYNTFN